MNQNLFSSTAIVETVSGSPNNAFYDMRQAIKGDLMQNAIINSCDIQSNQDINPLMPMPYMPGDVGINLSLGTSKSIEVSNNNIYNVKLGILLYDDGSSGSYNDAVANINNNNIQATNPNIAAASPNNYVNWAIILTSSNNTLGYYNERVVNCNNNILHNVQNGIMLNNWQGTNTHADFNDIALALDPLAQGGDYYGIWMVSGIPMDDNLLDPMGLPKTSGYVGNTVTGNTVLGNSDQQQQIGIYTQAQYGTNYGCNTVNNLQHGIKFNDVCYSTVLWDNWMDKSNQYGFTLSQAIIGQQGTKAGKGTGACPSNNHWAGTNAQWLTNYSIPHYKTFNDNSYNVNSSFVVKSAPTEFNPNGCGTYNNPLGLFIFPYQHTSSTLSNTNTLLYAGTLQIDCGRCNGGASKMAPSTDETANIETLEQIADETIELPADNADQRLYSLQQQLYDIVKAKPALLLQSNELQSFAQANNWTVLDYIHYTGKYLAQNDANTADMLLSYWPQSTKQLDENYYQYYNWVTNMKLDKTYKPNLANVLALANKCPQKNGKVVYAARALYNGLTHSVHSFNNNCNAVASRQTITKKDKQATINTVSIYPNPSNGLIRIDLPSSNASESIKWYVTITDVYGKVVKQQHLTAKQTQLNMANAKGLYFANVYNTITGKQTVTKIVLQ
jgi:Secretion system C-terminal sorting domain